MDRRDRIRAGMSRQRTRCSSKKKTKTVWPQEAFCQAGGGAKQRRALRRRGRERCNAYQFRPMMTAGDVSQRAASVIQVGGITEFMKVRRIADELGVKVVPHSLLFSVGLYWRRLTADVAAGQERLHRDVLHERPLPVARPHRLPAPMAASRCRKDPPPPHSPTPGWL